MKWMLFLSFFLFSCSNIKPLNSENKEMVKEEAQDKFAGPLINRAVDVEVQPGKVTFVEFDVNLPDGKWELNCNEREIPFFVKNKKAQLFLAESYFSNLKSFTCEFIEDDDLNEVEKVVVLEIKVKPYPYKSERLHVDKKRIDIKGKDLERVIKEKEIKKKLYLDSAAYYLFDTPFTVPLDSFVTSHYGNRRVFNNRKKSQHLGNDFRAKIGVPIPAANKGRVIFTGDLFFIGKVVIIDHGMGIFTNYGHLSKIKVHKGDLVEKGDIVGLSGKTGRVSGPHLHWGVKIQGHWVDGFSLVEQSQLKFGK